MRNRWPVWLLLMCLVVAGWSEHRALSLQAYQPATAYDGVAMLFLVDQSGSMGGAAYGSSVVDVPTDPQELRFETVQFALRTLSDYKAAVPPEVEFRMSVAYFGDDAEVGLDWTVVENASAAWSQREPDLLQTLSADTFGERNLGNTNFIDALQLAETQFDQLPDDGQRRLKTLVILTDGAPCAPTHPDWTTPSCTRQQDAINHMETVTTLAQNGFPSAEYQIYVVAVDENQRYWPTFESFWQDVTAGRGSAERVENSLDIADTFIRILTDSVARVREPVGAGDADDIVGERIVLEANATSVTVPPYYQTLRITFIKRQPDVSVSIQPPGGAALDASQGDVSISGADGIIEVWRVGSPAPGEWRIVTTEDTEVADVYLDLLRVNWSLDVQSSQTVYLPVQFELVLSDAAGDPLPFYREPRYALEVELSIQQPDGSVTGLALEPATGRNVYTASYTPEQPGMYQVNIRGTSQNVDGSPFVVLSQENTASFEVASAQLQIDGLPESDLLVSEEITLAAQLLNDSGETLAIDDVRIQATIINQAGEVTAEFPLRQQDDNAYQESITMDNPGQYRILVEAFTESDSGDARLIADAESALFSVDPANFLLLTIQEPRSDGTYYATEGTPGIITSFEPADLTVQVEVVGQNEGRPVNLTDYTDAEQPLNLTLIPADPEQSSQSLVLQPVTDATGLYRTTVSGLSPGDYTLELQPDPSVTLSGSTLFDPRTRNEQVQFSVSTNPQRLFTLGGTILLAVLLVLLVIFIVVREYRLRQHPATGMLSIGELDYEYGGYQELISVNLGGYGKNRVTLSSQLRSLPRELGIKKINIASRSARDTERGRVSVTVRMERGSDKSFTLRPNSERSLGYAGEREYVIRKDMEDYY